MPTTYTTSKGRRVTASKKPAKKNPGKKGAYKPAVKAGNMNRRRPFVETKARIKSEIAFRNSSDGSASGTMSTNYPNPLEIKQIDTANGFRQIYLDPFSRMSQGLDDSQMIGNTVFARSLTCKLQLWYPHRHLIGSNGLPLVNSQNPITRPIRMYAVAGWVTVPFARTPNTTPTESQTVTDDFHNHIEFQIREHFDNKADQLEFKSKVLSNLEITDFKLLKPKHQNRIAPQHQWVDNTDAVSPVPSLTLLGSNPYVSYSHTWKFNKKIHYTKGDDTSNATAAPDPDIENYYPNNVDKIPFLCFYMPDHADMVDHADVATKPAYRHNVMLTYTDS